jgi:hypothetical protein
VCVQPSLLISPVTCKTLMIISILFHPTWSSYKLHLPANALLLIKINTHHLIPVVCPPYVTEDWTITTTDQQNEPLGCLPGSGRHVEAGARSNNSRFQLRRFRNPSFAFAESADSSTSALCWLGGGLQWFPPAMFSGF